MILRGFTFTAETDGRTLNVLEFREEVSIFKCSTPELVEDVVVAARPLFPLEVLRKFSLVLFLLMVLLGLGLRELLGLVFPLLGPEPDNALVDISNACFAFARTAPLDAEIVFVLVPFVEPPPMVEFLLSFEMVEFESG